MADRETSYGHALLAGGMAGLSVDMALFPLDTIKTRLQSQQGFFKAGGFRGIYAGLPSAAIGSVPGAALFFMTYETVKQAANSKTPTHLQPIVHMVAASAGEVCACVVRVPCEVVKQRAQAAPHLSTLFVLRKTLSQEGVRGLYRGYFSTVFREIPFSLIQFPLWEFLKTSWSSHQGHRIEAWQSSVCGAISGGVSAALTTPLDVAKTRIMLAETGTSVAQGSIPYALRVVWSEKGIRGLFAGVVPRVMWISIGGAIFLGVYDKIKNLLEKLDSKS